MSSFCSSVCLLVLLGVLSAFGSPVHTTDELTKIHDYIANTLDLKKPSVSTHPPFNSVINSIKSSCQRKDDLQLMNVTLDVYMRIFSSILDQPAAPLLEMVSNRPQVELRLKKLQEKTQEMKRHLNHLSQLRENVLLKLSDIKVEEPEDQKRALAQFIEIYHAASVIGSRNCGSAHSSSAQ